MGHQGERQLADRLRFEDGEAIDVDFIDYH